MGIGDLEAAVGFFGRAAESNPAIRASRSGLGTVYLLSGPSGRGRFPSSTGRRAAGRSGTRGAVRSRHVAL